MYYLDEPRSRLRCCCWSDYEWEPHERLCPNHGKALRCESCGTYVELGVLAKWSDPTVCYRCGGATELLFDPEVRQAEQRLERMMAATDQEDF